MACECCFCYILRPSTARPSQQAHIGCSTHVYSLQSPTAKRFTMKPTRPAKKIPQRWPDAAERELESAPEHAREASRSRIERVVGGAAIVPSAVAEGATATASALVHQHLWAHRCRSHSHATGREQLLVAHKALHLERAQEELLACELHRAGKHAPGTAHSASADLLLSNEKWSGGFPHD